MVDENEFYEKLFKEFKDLNNNPVEIELWKNNQIRELMNKFKSKQDSLTLKNGLLVLMTLFDEKILDSFYLESKDLENLNENNKETLISLLRREID
jgi:hypothetical protein